MDAEKAEILDAISDLNQQAIALAERAETYVFGSPINSFTQSFATPVTDALAGLARHVVLNTKAEPHGR